MRYVCGISYLGTRYRGWQAQKNHILTVQNLVNSALSRVADEPIKSFCSGRTDAGVHALGQIIHFDCHADRPPHNWVRGANSFLPDDICINWCRVTEDNFHARFSATSRTYHYLIYNDQYTNILWHNRCLHEVRPLCVDRMHKAAQHLLGKKDFSSFRASGCQSQSAVRHVMQAEVSQYQSWILFKVQADAFLYHMVRNIVGSLLEVGLGQSPEWFSDTISVQDRKKVPATAAAQGLYFMRAQFPKKYSILEDMYRWDWYED